MFPSVFALEEAAHPDYESGLFIAALERRILNRDPADAYLIGAKQTGTMIDRHPEVFLSL